MLLLAPWLAGQETFDRLAERHALNRVQRLYRLAAVSSGRDGHLLLKQDLAAVELRDQLVNRDGDMRFAG